MVLRSRQSAIVQKTSAPKDLRSVTLANGDVLLEVFNTVGDATNMTIPSSLACNPSTAKTDLHAFTYYFDHSVYMDPAEINPELSLPNGVETIQVPPGMSGTCASGLPPHPTCSFAPLFDSRLDAPFPAVLLGLIFKECSEAMKGYFVPSIAQESEYPKASYNYNDPSCDSATTICLHGIDVCDVNAWPAFCVPTPTCTLERAAGKACQLYQMGNPETEPVSNREPTLCLPGYYCPSLSKMVVCPEGSYCPPGSHTPIPCPHLAYCGREQIQPILWGPAVLCLIIDAVLVLAYKYNKHINRCNIAARRARRTRELSFGGSEDPTTTSEQSSSAPLLARDTRLRKQLAAGFTRAHGSAGIKMDFEFTNLSVTLPASRRGDVDRKILAGVSGKLRDGSVTAIMGPSGAGKTTLLTTLLGGDGMAGLKRSGTLKINNAIVEDISVYRRQVAYVPQEDIMLRELTVRDNVEFSARMRLPSSWTDAEITSFFEAVLSAMHLEEVEDQPIGDENKRGISGGQRKRVNVAMELVAAPLTIFLDEATSGLDSTSALLLCELLGYSAQHFGLTVAMVVHQPRIEIWENLDVVLLLAPGGRTVFQGKCSEAQEFFAREHGIEFSMRSNPADVIMDAIANDDDLLKTTSQAEVNNNLKASMPQRWEEIWKERQLLQKRESTRCAMPKIDSVLSARQAHYSSHQRVKHYARQFWLCHLRCLKQQRARVLEVIVEVLCSVLTGLLIGFACPSYFVQSYAVRAMTFDDPRTGQPIQLALPLNFVGPAGDLDIIAQISMLSAAAIGLSAAPPAVRLFGRDRSVYRREVARGHSRLPYYCGVDTASWYRIGLAAAHFLATFSLLSPMFIPVGGFLLLVLLYYFCVYGLAQIISMTMSPSNSQLVGVVVTLFAAVLGGYIPDIPLWFKQLNYQWWGFSALWLLSSRGYEDTFDLVVAAEYYNLSSSPEILTSLFGFMLLIGIVYRFLSLIAMVLQPKGGPAELIVANCKRVFRFRTS